MKETVLWTWGCLFLVCPWPRPGLQDMGLYS